MILTTAKQVLNIEISAIHDLLNRLDNNFVHAVELISTCRGRVIVTGIGKSGIISRKIAATLSATGTPSFFLHPTEGAHGDLGILMKQDCVVAVSYSGESTELIALIPTIKKLGLPLITFTGYPQSQLARVSDVVVDISVKQEACPYDISPTASTTVCLALGDALAISVMKRKGITKDDFAVYHPGGSIGRKLLWRVKDVMHRGKENPVILENKKIKDAILVMTRTRMGAVTVVNRTGSLVGYLTDGDLRRALPQYKNILSQPITRLMTRNCTSITVDKLAVEAAKLMEENGFDNLPVIDKHGKVVGIIDERDLLRYGIN